MGGIGLFLLRGSGSLSIRNGWEGNVFVEKRVGVGCFSWKLGGSGLFLLKNG